MNTPVIKCWVCLAFSEILLDTQTYTFQVLPVGVSLDFCLSSPFSNGLISVIRSAYVGDMRTELGTPLASIRSRALGNPFLRDRSSYTGNEIPSRPLLL